MKQKQKQSPSANIKYWRLKKYKRWENASLEELIIAHTKIESGEIDISKEEMRKESTGVKKKVHIDDVLEDPRNDTSIVKGLRVRRFMVEALKDVMVIGLLKSNEEEISFYRQIYSTSNITANELAYLTDDKESSVKYYLRRYGIVKMPKNVLVDINSVDKLLAFLRKPLFKLTKSPTDETPEEFRERYNKLSFQAFDKVQNIITFGEQKKDEIKNLNSAISALGNIMKVEMEAKTLLDVKTTKQNELKEKEINKNAPKETTVINFNGDIDAQDLFLAIRTSFEKGTGMSNEEIEKLMIDVTNSVQENLEGQNDSQN